MSCQPVINRFIENAMGERLRWIQQELTRQLGGMASVPLAAVQAPIALPTADQAEVAHCLTHIIGGLVSGELMKNAAVKAGYRRR